MISNTENVKRSSCTFLRILSFLLLVGLPAGVLSAQSQQDVSVSGIVTDASSGETLPGVNISVKGTTSGTSTNTNGQYELTVGSLQDTLVFSFVGFQRQEVPINGRSSVDIAMQTQTITGQELVVVGYGQQRKSDLTGAISSIGEKELQNISTNATIADALQGRMAGVEVNHSNHAPGGGITVKIRGLSTLTAGGQPLYVIDGMPITTDFRTNGAKFVNNNSSSTGPPPSPLNSINVSNIASMQVLKGPSATSIYGSRGSNGVVLITTKEGTAGQQRIDIESSFGLQKVGRTLDLLDAQQYAQQVNDAANQNGQSPVYTQQQMSSFGNGTNWQDQIYQLAPVNEQQIAFSGGNTNLQYNITGNYANQEGIIKGSRFLKYGASSNINGQISSRLKVQNNFMYVTSTNRMAFTGGIGENSNIIKQALSAPPTIPVRNEQDELSNFSNFPQGRADNPLFLANKYEQIANTDRIIENASASYDIYKGLSVKTRIGADIRNWRYNKYIPIESSQYPNGYARQITERTVNFNNSNTLRFQTNIDKNQIKLLGGFSFQQQKDELSQAEATDFPTDDFKTNKLSAGANPLAPRSNARKHRLISYFGRVNYQYDNKYLITGTLRRDGSSKFGPNNKFGTFPSVAVAWKMGNENFIDNLNIFSGLKIRASYGITGNENIGLYKSKSNLEFQFNGGNSYYFNNNLVPIIRFGGVGNPNISWEKSEEFNVGLDVGLLENKINFSLNAYEQNTTDLLLQQPLPLQSGFETGLRNTGEIRNRGIEFELSTQNIQNNLISWTSNFNISFNRNKIQSLGTRPSGSPVSNFIVDVLSGGTVEPFSNAINLKVGHPVGTYYGYTRRGIWHSQEEINQAASQLGARPGDVRFEDLNNDEEINSEDLSLIGDPNPKFTFGLTNNFSVKNWDLRVYLYGKVGNDVVNIPKAELQSGVGLGIGRLQRWTPQNKQGSQVGATSNYSKSGLLNSGLIEDGSFLRVGDISLSYSLPLQSATALKRLKLTLSVQNPFTITNYSGYDPEVNAQGGTRNNNVIRGIDRYSYPIARTANLKLNLGF